jgi:uncharacterized protein (TIGR02246 family)
MSNVDVIRQLVERWNAGELEGVLALFADDAVLVNGPDWPEQGSIRGLEGIRSSIDEWLGAWQSSQVELGSVAAVGDKVVAEGTWSTRGRSSGVSGKMPANTLCTVRHGKIASLEWFADHDAAVAAARHT